jgi:curli production assembly/transport component CsgG
MKNLLLVVTLMSIISGCASIAIPNDTMCRGSFMECIELPQQVELPTYEQLRKLPPAEQQPVVAVYSFGDLTGQRKEGDAPLYSTAVTQGAKELLIDALKAAGAGDTGNGTWFRVVERGMSLDSLIRERQIIRSTREDYEQATGEAQPNLQPMLFAGMLFEGGIVGYDTNVETGGNGARYLGIGATNQYRRDSVVVSLRAVSTLTGEIILNVQTYKTVLSVGLAGDVFRFVDMDTKLIEMETGMTQNESVTWAVRSAIEAAVLALIEQGDKRGYWKINYPEDETKEDVINNEESTVVETFETEIKPNDVSIIDKLFTPKEDSQEEIL